MTPVPATSRRPLSPNQRAMWATQRRHRSSPLLNVALSVHIGGRVDAHLIADSFASVAAEVPTLYSHVVEDNGEPWWHTADAVVTTPIDEVALADVHDWAAGQVRVPIDPTITVYAGRIARHEDGSATWLLNMHHLATDASTAALLVEATARRYLDDAAPLELVDFGDWLASASETSGTRIERAKAHWEMVDLRRPLDHLYSQRSKSRPATIRNTLMLGADTVVPEHAATISEQLGWTTLLAATSAGLVGRLTGESTATVGVPVHFRNARTQHVVGPLMEVVPVEIDVDVDASLGDLVDTTSESLIEAIGQALPLTLPAFEVDAMVNVTSHAPINSFADHPTTVEWIHPSSMEPSNLFRLQLTPYGVDGRELVLDLNADVAPPNVARPAVHVQRLLDAIIDGPDAILGDVELLDPAELETVRAWGKGPAARRGDSSSSMIVDRLAAALEDRGDTALIDGDREISGRDLWGRARVAAKRLRQLGVGPSIRVGVEMYRSAEAVVAILGVLVAGGSYVPIDPAQPERRRIRLAERAGCLLVVRDLDDLAGTPAPHSNDEPAPESEARPDDEAYLLFTSGSSGEPKGVPITHAGLATYIDTAVSSYMTGPPPTAALFSALTFDLTVTTLFGPLLAGGRLVVVRDDGAAGLVAISADERIDWLKATPSHLEVLCQLGPVCRLRRIVVGGEQFTRTLADTMRATFGDDLTIYNEYGPTEAVVGCMVHVADPEDEGPHVPIGRPMPDVSLRIVDDRLMDVPVGASGELLISSPGLTAGYLDESDDLDRFVIVDDQRWYRSGDTVRLLDDDTAVYLGRADEQLKVGGIRIEPSEIEAALVEHPGVTAARVGLWSPSAAAHRRHCVRCGLPDDVPDADFDVDGVCSTCHHFARIEAQAAEYFGDLDDLKMRVAEATAGRTGEYDILHLLSGGKDSTYALYQLVALGFRVRVLTLDNGFISPEALENARRSTEDLGVDAEIATSPVMNDVLRASLDRFSNVCQGCYKTIYTLAAETAVEHDIPVITTGLSRGQLFETRLTPHQFEQDRFDVDAIDAAVVEARRQYHRADDPVNRLLGSSVFDDEGYFDDVTYIDFYRYVDVALADMLAFLDQSAPWVRPSDTGRSTNCLVNAAGIHVHTQEQGFHNYAIPYAWDVRLGHKTRDEAIAELDDQLDLDEVGSMLGEIGYRLRPRQILTAWIQTSDEASVGRGDLHSFLADRVPSYAVPAAYVEVGEIPLTANGKLDMASLPAPSRTIRSTTVAITATTPLERRIVAAYERTLGVEPVAVDDDFFELGGDSLAALGLAAHLRTELGIELLDEMIFAFVTPRELARALDVVAVDLPARAPTTSPDAAKSAHGEGDAERDSETDAAGPPLTVGEQALLFEHSMGRRVQRYHVARDYVIDRSDADDRLDLARLEDALRDVASVHAPLCWTFGSPRRHRRRAELVESDVTAATVTADDFGFAADRAVRRPFDLDAGPVLRLVARHVDDGTDRVCVIVHHVACDEIGFDTLMNEVAARYDQRATGSARPESPPVGHWHSAHATESADHSEARRFWSEMLSAEPCERHLGAPAAGTADGYVERPLGVTTRELSRRGVGVFASSLAAIGVALRRRTDGTGIGVGVVSSTRTDPAVDAAVGYRVNTLPLLFRVDLERSLAAIAEDTARTLNAALSHRFLPVSTLVGERKRRNESSPDLSVIVAHETTAPCTIAGQDVEPVARWAGHAVAEATIFIREHGDDLTAAIEYSGTAIDADGAEALLEDVARAIEAMAFDRSTLAGDVVWGHRPQPQRSADALDVTTTLHELVTTAAPRDPNRVAVVCGDDEITWGQLTATSRDLAAELDHSGRGRAVGVDCRRSVWAPAAMLAAMRSGAAYVPIDPAYPEAHVSQVLSDTEAATILTASPDSLPRSMRQLQRIDLRQLPTDQAAAAQTGSAASPHDLAYVIHTSGSTGEPKGVGVTHANIVASTVARRARYGDAPSVFLLVSSFAFDSSMVGLWWTLASGGTVVLPEQGRHDDVEHLADLVATHAVTHTLMLPSLYDALLDVEDPSRLRTLRTVIVAGEECPIRLVDHHAAVMPDTELHNEYGPTEATVWTHSHRLHPGPRCKGRVPIGRPVPGTAARVEAPEGHVRPTGVPGELLVSGPGVVPGYLGRADLTAERFVEREGVRWYRTGDLVSRDGDGLFHFHGRIDDQVKIRGHRIELGAVEATLRTAARVVDAAVAVDTAGASHRLVALIESDAPTSEALIADVRRTAERHLAAHMRPTSYAVTAALPRRPNGKLDRGLVVRAVAAAKRTGESPPGASRSGTSSGEPPSVRRSAEGSTEAEAVLLATWRDVLGTDDIGPHDDFYDLGGDSIVAIRVASAVRRSGIVITPRDIFENPTVAALAAAAQARPASPSDTQATAVDVVPLTPIQRWFFGQDFANPDRFVQAMWLDIDPSVSDEVIAAAVERLVAHHDMLRATFTNETGDVEQRIGAGAGVELILADQPDAPGLMDRVDQTIDISSGPLVAAGLLRERDRTRMYLAVHHLVVDAVSWAILVDDLSEILEASTSDRPASLPPTATSVATWVQHLTSASEQFDISAIDSRGTALPSLETGLELDTESLVSTVERPNGIRWSATELERIVIVATAHAAGLCLPAPLVTAGVTTVAIERHGRDIANGIADGGGYLDLSRTVGWMTGVERLTLAAGTSPQDTSSTVARLLDDPARVHDDLVALRTRTTDRSRDALRLTFFTSASFAAATSGRGAGGSGALLDTSGPFARSGPDNHRTQAVGVLATLSENTLTIEVEHSPNAVDRATIARFVDHLNASVAELLDEPTAQSGPGRQYDLSPLGDADMARLARTLEAVDAVHG